MIAFTVYTRPHDRPLLVREGFSLGAFVFGPLWLLAHRAWVPGILACCAAALIALLSDGPTTTILSVGLNWLLGLSGRDLCRWSLERRGYVLAQVVMAANTEAALARLFERRPDLLAEEAA